MTNNSSFSRPEIIVINYRKKGREKSKVCDLIIRWKNQYIKYLYRDKNQHNKKKSKAKKKNLLKYKII